MFMLLAVNITFISFRLFVCFFFLEGVTLDAGKLAVARVDWSNANMI
jgi:hypothetical protein